MGQDYLKLKSILQCDPLHIFQTQFNGHFLKSNEDKKKKLIRHLIHLLECVCVLNELEDKLTSCPYISAK